MDWLGFDNSKAPKTYGKKATVGIALPSPAASSSSSSLSSLSSSSSFHIQPIKEDDENPFDSTSSFVRTNSNTRNTTALRQQSSQDMNRMKTDSINSNFEKKPIAKRKNGGEPVSSLPQETKKTRTSPLLTVPEDDICSSPSFNSHQGHNTTTNDISSAFNSNMRNTSTRNKKKFDLKDWVSDGHISDLIYLQSEISNYDDKAKGHFAFQFMINVPNWPKDDKTRLSNWLERIGYSEQLFGDASVYKSFNSQVSLSELRRILSQAGHNSFVNNNSMLNATPHLVRSQTWSANTSMAQSGKLKSVNKKAGSFDASSVRPRSHSGHAVSSLRIDTDLPKRFPMRNKELEIDDDNSDRAESPGLFSEPPTPFSSIDHFSPSFGNFPPSLSRASSASPNTAALISSIETKMRFNVGSFISVSEDVGIDSNLQKEGMAKTLEESNQAANSVLETDNNIKAEDDLNESQHSKNEESDTSTVLDPTDDHHFDPDLLNRPISPLRAEESGENSISCFLPFSKSLERILHSPIVVNSATSIDSNDKKAIQGACMSPFNPPIFSGSALPSTDSEENLLYGGIRDRKFHNKDIGPKALRRSVSMPTQPTKCLLPGVQTPLQSSMSMSQNDAIGEFQTPQSIRLPKKCSGKDDDWGVSQPASATCLRAMEMTFNMPFRMSLSTSAGKQVMRAHSASDFDINYKSATIMSNDGTPLGNPPNTQVNNNWKYQVPAMHSVSISGPFHDQNEYINADNDVRMLDDNTYENSDYIKNIAQVLKMRQSPSTENLPAPSFQTSTSSFAERNDGSELDTTRARRQHKNSAAKLRRMSFRGNHKHVHFLLNEEEDLSLSPAVVAKAKSSRRRRQSLFEKNVKSMAIDDGNNDHAFDSYDSNKHPDIPNVNETNFKGIIIGGTYQQCFEDGCPVVAAPSSYEKRVTGLRNTSNGLEIKVYIPQDKTTQLINLGTQWKWMRSNPTGFLVSKNLVRTGESIILYYLSRHPYDWMESALDEHANSCDMSILDNSIMPANSSDCHEMSNSAIDTSNLNTSLYMLNQSASPCYHALDLVYHHNHDSSREINQSLRDNYDFSEIAAALYATNIDWSQSSIITSVLEFLVVDNSQSATAGGRRTKTQKFIGDDTKSYRLVSKAWALASYRLLARHMSNFDNCQSFTWTNWARFVKNYGRGFFLSQGACKSVYCIQDFKGAKQAVSIMDIDDLTKRGMNNMISKELEISMLCSSLVDLKICPNLVQIYSIFRSECGIPDTLWRQKPEKNQVKIDSSSIVIPRKNQVQKGSFQYIRMEFCNGGDLEELVRKNVELDTNYITSMLFQMCFSLYSCREQLSMRHYDIKLLNFFACLGSAALTGVKRNVCESRNLSSPFELFRPSVDNIVNLRIGFGNSVYVLPLRANSYELVKLADFGTSDIGSGTLGDPITTDQFTTLENSPPEFLIMGSLCRQSYAADTFCLGLSFLHLLTGHEPYEELLKDVKCPAYLQELLAPYWETNDPDSPYYIISETMNSLEGDDGKVLYDTIYRYIVLLGVPSELLSTNSISPWINNPVWNCILEALDYLPSTSISTNRRIKKIKEDCSRQYNKDRQLWSFASGVNPIIVNARVKLDSIDGATKLFERMLHFDPSRRCTMHEALHSPMFNIFKDNNYDHNTCASIDYNNNSHDNNYRGIGRGNGNDICNFTTAFMHYFRHNDNGSNGLPLL